MCASLTLLCCLLALAPLGADESDPHRKLYDEATRVFSDLEAHPLPAPNPDQDTEAELLRAMAHGDRAVDLALYRRLDLDAVTERLLPALDGSFGRENVGGQMATVRLFLVRGHKLCLEGNVAEGQGWLLKAHRMARRPNGDGNLLRLLTAIALENMTLAADGAYVGTWSEPDRLAYVRALEALPPMAGVRRAVLLDDLSLDEPTRFRTLLPLLKPLNSAQRREKLMATWPLARGFEPEFLRCYEGMVDNLTLESWDALLLQVADGLEPLNLDKLRAFEARVTAAAAFAKDPTTSPNAPTTPLQKGEAFYLSLLGSSIQRIARNRLDLDLKTQLLKVALRRGAAFDATDLVGLNSAQHGPLKLGIDETSQRQAIKGGDRDECFLPLGRRR
jgi:hypothetical protein